MPVFKMSTSLAANNPETLRSLDHIVLGIGCMIRVTYFLVVDSIDKDNLPPGVSDRDYRFFRKSQQQIKVVLAFATILYSIVFMLLVQLWCPHSES